MAIAKSSIPALPPSAKLTFQEDWSRGRIDEAKWYVPRKKWGGGNHGVVPENVAIKEDVLNGKNVKVLVCEAHGDQYNGPVSGLWGKKTRVGGVIVSKPFFASGRYEVVMKIGSTKNHDGGPADPTRPSGAVMAIWTYGYRFVHVPKERMHEFLFETPMFNPHMPRYGIGANEYWSELDFPELGKNGEFNRAMYNTFCQNRHHPELFDVRSAIDGHFHTYTTDWRTRLEELKGVTDSQVVEFRGYWWVKDKSIPFEKYLGNPLKKLSANRYAVYRGDRAVHWIDGKKVAENTRFVPVMTGQLNLGVWLPDWAGPAKWKTATASFGPVKVWQYNDPGDVRGIITQDIDNNFDKQGREIR